MIKTVRIDLGGVNIRGMKPKLLDMCQFLEQALDLDVRNEVRYVGICPIRPVCYVEFFEEKRTEEIGRALKKGVDWACGQIFGHRVDEKLKTIRVRGVGSGEGEEEVKKVLEKYVEVLEVRRKKLEEYP